MRRSKKETLKASVLRLISALDWVEFNKKDSENIYSIIDDIKLILNHTRNENIRRSNKRVCH